MKKLSIAFLFSLVVSVAQAAEFSITMDDFNTVESAKFLPIERSRRILKTLENNHTKAALFVVGQYVESENGKKLLNEWSKQGHLIANHTFTHPRYGSNITFSDFSAEIKRCESVIESYPGFRRFFRFPMLAEGNTPEKRDQLRVWLKDQGYKVGSVTIDASNWYIDQRLRDRLAIKPNADLKPYRDYYLAHIWDRAQYYNELSKKVLGREVKHTLLIHFNLLNALFLNDLLSMLKTKGWKLIDAKEAFNDPVFDRLPNSMPSGQSLVWGLAKESGKYDSELRYPSEDNTYEKPKMDALGL
jgi:peptidoglycan/xylan/chitin deacetylase (PgdA/CDA1 family)